MRGFGTQTADSTPLTHHGPVNLVLPVWSSTWHLNIILLLRDKSSDMSDFLFSQMGKIYQAYLGMGAEPSISFQAVIGPLGPRKIMGVGSYIEKTISPCQWMTWRVEVSISSCEGSEERDSKSVAPHPRESGGSKLILL